MAKMKARSGTVAEPSSSPNDAGCRANELQGKAMEQIEEAVRLVQEIKNLLRSI
jgi:hypothetical protein